MVKVKKFKAYMPPPEIAPKLISLPYDVMDTKEARKMAEGNEQCFLRVSRCELELPDNVDPHSEEVYKHARDNLHKFMDKKYLVKDDESRVYIYAQKMGSHIQYGIMALSHIDDYEKGLIKKHELTRKDKELDRTTITNIQNANTGPVFLTYKHKDTIDSVVHEVVTNQKPYAHVAASDGFEHTVSFWNFEKI